MTLLEADRLLRLYPQAGGAVALLSFSPRPFSAASVVASQGGKVFVKRHHRSVRDREGLLEEHRFLTFLAGAMDGSLAQTPLRNADGDTVTCIGDWTYEAHPVARGLDLYEDALSWTPFRSAGHARAAGRALAGLHLAAEGFHAPPRKARQLVSSFHIFGWGELAADPAARMEEYLESRPLLRKYAERRDWRRSFDELLLPMYRKLSAWGKYLKPLWTHNDFHGSNMTWSDTSASAHVTGIVDFGLADRTNAVYDLAILIERSAVEWLKMDDPTAELVHFDHVDAALEGYEELRPLSYEESRALPALLPLAHCEFALSETDYFLSILGSEEKARLAYEGYFVAHAAWFRGAQGRRLLDHLDLWAASDARKREAAK